MLNFIQKNLSSLYAQFTTKVHALFGRATVDEQTLKELEALLLHADTGPVTTQKIIAQLKQHPAHTGQELKEQLATLLLTIATKIPAPGNASIYLLVGINGSGKTTAAAKLAALHTQNNKKVLLVAADTFRAAATEQLSQWAQRINVDIITGKQDQDPASVVFAACQAFKTGNYDTLIIDTAGRLQTKTNLMNELEKIRRTIRKQLPEAPVCTLLTLDSMLGQNSFDQAQLFHASTPINGIILTKMDGSAKGGIIFHIIDSLNIPIAYLSYGEQLEQLKAFNPQEFVATLLE